MLAKPTIPRTSDPLLDRIFDVIRKSLGDLFSDPAADFADVGVTALSSGTNTVQHKLGAAPSRWSLTFLDANSAVWITAMDASTLTIHASANCNAAFRVW